MLVSIDQLIGQMFGSYQLERLLGSGSLSSVFAASNTVSTQSSGEPHSVMVTVFTLPTGCEGKARERFMIRFQEEAQRLVELSHPNIVPVYEFGEQFGYPYLVTPLTEGNSLSTSLKQKATAGTCPYAPEQTLTILQQMAWALDYAHQNGYVHGSLKLSNILLVGDEPNQQIHIAGFGLVRLLEMRGIGRVDHLYPHLFSVAGTLLVNTTYLAPEVINGQVADAQADIYALGIIIFELLSGRPPFIGDDPFVVAQQQLTARRPSLQEVCPDASDDLVALDLVLQRALERNPTHRLSSAGKLANAFKRALNVLKEAEHSAKLSTQPKKQESQTQFNTSISSTSTASIPSAPAAVTSSSWLAGSASSTEDAWMRVPGTTSAKLPALDRTKDNSLPLVSPGLSGETGPWRGVPLFSSPSHSLQLQSQQTQPSNNLYVSVTENKPLQRTTDQVSALSVNKAVHTNPSNLATTSRPINNINSMNGNLQTQNPFVNSPQPPLPVFPMPQMEQVRGNLHSSLKVSAKTDVSYTQDTGDLVAHEKQQVTREKGKSTHKTRRAILLTSGVVVACALGFGGFDLLNGLQDRGQSQINETDVVKNTGSTSALHSNASQKPGINNAANQGMLLGNKNMPVNTAKDFTNPADQKASILVHLPSGAFVAYEKACTHQGVLVNYDPTTQKLVCPLHHSVFDPANKAAVLSGPAPAPLPSVALQMLSDGSVIVG